MLSSTAPEISVGAVHEQLLMLPYLSAKAELCRSLLNLSPCKLRATAGLARSKLSRCTLLHPSSDSEHPGCPTEGSSAATCFSAPFAQIRAATKTCRPCNQWAPHL